MADVFRTKLRKIGSSVGVLIPKEQLQNLEVDVGDEIDVALLTHKKLAAIQSGFGMAKHFTKPFERDKKSREF
ncbi:MAG: hypothetical protein AABX38_01685 [Candidatus Micrarchaeota archaeon]